MKKVAVILLSAAFLSVGFTSCRDQEKELSEEEAIIQEMQAEGADTKVKSDDGDTKIKMETETKEVKIKTDEDGDSKIKVDVDN
ncbi:MULTISPECIES: hypothetical protein [Aequorivita]|jgi:ABC-type enterochelin transport system substrate-binding protein|uniref:Membrane or secreted protein n=2 Tax=Aequorivita TaxID=153265 RepID=A0AB35YPQ8_9FLAO|nr:hypothetical protein [Aequorivita sp. Ant34-E75]WGF93141.1 hypothetical protein QCQ61_02890 [Aequorivita sp. Ant34-E75]